MTFAELLRFLLSHDVQVAADGPRLRYDAPDDLVTDELIAALRQHKAALLAWLTATDPHGQVATRTLPSYVQEHFWHRARQHPRPAVYTVAVRLHFRGPIAPAALEAAVNWLVGRHETLRCRFTPYPGADGEDVSREVLAHRPATLPTTDLTAIPAPERKRALDRACGELVAQGFALDGPALWRARLFTVDTHHHVLLWTLHHITCDGWSLNLLLDELISAYAQLQAGGAPKAEPVAMAHSDYIRSERRALTGRQRDTRVDFWRDVLRGVSLDVALPVDTVPPDRPSGRGAVYDLHVTGDVVAGLHTIARRLGTTLYVVVLSAYALVLSRITGKGEVVVPISHANRADQRHHTVVGQVADRLPIRIPVTGAATFPALVARVGERVFTAMDHALPLGLILASLPAPPRPDPLYPTLLFTLLPESSRGWRTGESAVTVQSDGAEGLARMWLYCFLQASADGLRGGLEYDTDRFAPDTVATWATAFTTLLAQVAQHPDLPIGPD